MRYHYFIRWEVADGMHEYIERQIISTKKRLDQETFTALYFKEFLKDWYDYATDSLDEDGLSIVMVIDRSVRLYDFKEITKDEREVLLKTGASYETSL